MGEQAKIELSAERKAALFYWASGELLYEIEDVNGMAYYAVAESLAEAIELVEDEFGSFGPTRPVSQAKLIYPEHVFESFEAEFGTYIPGPVSAAELIKRHGPGLVGNVEH